MTEYTSYMSSFICLSMYVSLLHICKCKRVYRHKLHRVLKYDVRIGDLSYTRNVFLRFPLVAFFFASVFRAFLSSASPYTQCATTNVRASYEKVCMKRMNRNPLAKFVQIHRNLSALHPWFHPYPFPNTRYFFMPLVLHMQIGIPAKLCKASGA